MKQKVNGIILNPFAQAGNSQKSFDIFKTSDEFFHLGMHQAKFFNCSHFQSLSQLKNELVLWLEDLANHTEGNIVAVGGDGMIHMALNALMNLSLESRKKITLGAIGTGSSNDYHKPYLGTGRGLYKKIPFRLDFSNSQLFDLGAVEFTDPLEFKEYFIINASLGATALGNWFFNNPDQTLKKLKKTSTSAAITYATFWALKNFKSQVMNVEFNDNKLTLPVTNLGVIKNPHFTGSLFYPHAPLYNDGHFHLYLAHSLNFFELLRLTFDLSNGKFKSSPKKLHEIVKLIKLNSFEQDFIIELDGEILKTKSASIHVEEQAVYLCP